MIPVMVDIKRAILELLSDGVYRTVKEVHAELAKSFGLTKQEIESRNPSDTDRTFNHRIRAAKQQLKKNYDIEDIDGYFKLRRCNP